MSHYEAAPPITKLNSPNFFDVIENCSITQFTISRSFVACNMKNPMECSTGNFRRNVGLRIGVLTVLKMLRLLRASCLVDFKCWNFRVSWAQCRYRCYDCQDFVFCTPRYAQLSRPRSTEVCRMFVLYATKDAEASRLLVLCTLKTLEVSNRGSRFAAIQIAIGSQRFKIARCKSQPQNPCESL